MVIRSIWYRFEVVRLCVIVSLMRTGTPCVTPELSELAAGCWQQLDAAARIAASSAGDSLLLTFLYCLSFLVPNQ
jgi:hypothetical protein